MDHVTDSVTRLARTRARMLKLLLIFTVTSTFTECFEIFKLPRLVGGKPTTPSAYPFMAAVQLKDGHHVCGGSLLDSNWVISAAHCFTDMKRQDLRVVLGDHDRSVLEASEQTFSVSQLKLHPFFSETNPNGYFLPNDLALLKLSHPALINSYTAPIHLPSSCSYNVTGRRCKILGWGRPSSDALEVSDVLQEAAVTTHSVQQCKLTWGNYTYHGQICTFEPGVSSCSGVSGGPLICVDINNYVLVGVSSWTDTQCRDYPSVYVDVVQEREWIEAVMNNVD